MAQSRLRQITLSRLFERAHHRLKDWKHLPDGSLDWLIILCRCTDVALKENGRTLQGLQQLNVLRNNRPIVGREQI